MPGMCPQRNRFAVVGLNGLHAGSPQNYLHVAREQTRKALKTDRYLDDGPGRDRPGPTVFSKEKVQP